MPHSFSDAAISSIEHGISSLEHAYLDIVHRDYHWIVGVLLATLAAILGNLGLNLQKLTHLKSSHLDESQRRKYWKSPVWISGIACLILGSMFDFVALGYGAQSIIAPLGSITLVSNVFLAPLMLGETFSRSDIFATAIIVIGAVLSISFASHQDTRYRMETVFSFFTRPRFAIYACFIMLTVLAAWWSAIVLERMRQEEDPRYIALCKYHRFSYAALSGIIGAQSVLFAKCLAELVGDWFAGHGFPFFHYQCYLIGACMFACIFLQIKWMNSGLLKFDAIYMVPVFQSFWILVSVIGGLVFFGEFLQMHGSQLVWFPVGISLTILGVYWLSKRKIEDTIASENVSESEPLIKEHQNRHIEFDPEIGYLGTGAPAAFGGSAMARTAVVFTPSEKPRKSWIPSKIWGYFKKSRAIDDL